LAALAVAGLPTDRFVFLGFLPPKAAARRADLALFARTPATLVLYEAPQRLAETLADLASALGDREAAVARELTKAFEEVVRAPLSELAVRYAESPPRGEIVIVVGPPTQTEHWAAVDVDAALRARLAQASVKIASGEVAALSGWPKRDVYARALALKAEDA
jgi:16S rRNA (cytidine1402-2'-O)-methyltransferase